MVSLKVVSFPFQSILFKSILLVILLECIYRFNQKRINIELILFLGNFPSNDYKPIFLGPKENSDFAHFHSLGLTKICVWFKQNCVFDSNSPRLHSSWWLFLLVPLLFQLVHHNHDKSLLCHASETLILNRNNCQMVLKNKTWKPHRHTDMDIMEV